MTTDTLPDRSALPTALTEREQWVCWRTQERGGKQTKIPVTPSTGQFASATDPSTWASFENARDAALDGELAGVGFVFTDDDSLVGVDLDACRDPDTGAIDAWAETVVDILESYTEVSPSGTGLHVLIEGTLPGDRNRRGDLEVYETARFFTVTGDQIPSTPDDVHQRSHGLDVVYREYLVDDTTADSGDTGAIEDDSIAGEGDATSESDTSPQPESTPSTDDDPAATPTDGSSPLSDEELLEKARAAANGEKFDRLFRGDTSGYESQSEADFALCSMLAFWSGGDQTQVDRLVRRSGLIRTKWDEVHFRDGATYGEKTVERAIAGTTEYYTPGGTEHFTDATTPLDDADDQIVLTDERLQRIEARERVRLRTIERLETEVTELTAQTEHLETQLEQERAQRRRLERQRDDESSEQHSLWRRFRRYLGRSDQNQ